MLVLIDESGDTGMQLARGSSNLFTVTLVIVDDHDEAEKLDRRIDELRRELHLSDRYEFHFNECPRKLRVAFLQATARFSFYYFGFVVNKAALSSSEFDSSSSFYEYVCGVVFMNARPYLENASVRIDGKGELEFKRKLTSYLKKKINDPQSSYRHIKKISSSDSSRSNLVQLADMVCGAIVRSYRSDKKDAELYRKIIKHRENSVRFWPD